jgi:hypothetical protein
VKKGGLNADPKKAMLCVTIAGKFGENFRRIHWLDAWARRREGK